MGSSKQKKNLKRSKLISFLSNLAHKVKNLNQNLYNSSLVKNNLRNYNLNKKKLIEQESKPNKTSY
jgi:hypothetical protein